MHVKRKSCGFYDNKLNALEKPNKCKLLKKKKKYTFVYGKTKLKDQKQNVIKNLVELHSNCFRVLKFSLH